MRRLPTRDRHSLLVPLAGALLGLSCARPAAGPAAAPGPAATDSARAPAPAPHVAAAIPESAGRPARDVEDAKWSPIQTDFPYQASVMTAPFPAGNTTNKAVSIRLPDGAEGAAMAFDTDLLRMSAGWTGAFLTATGVTFDTSHGGHPHLAGTQRFGTRVGPGWADAKGAFADRRPIPYGPLPEAWARWNGLHVAGDRVVLDYTVHGTRVLEEPSAITRDGVTSFVRTFELRAPGRSQAPLRLIVADLGEATVTETTVDGRRALVATTPTQVTRALVEPADAALRLHLPPGGDRLILDVARPRAAARTPLRFRVVLAVSSRERADAPVPGLGAPPVLAPFERGGRRHWPTPIVTRGVLGQGPGPYVVDRLTTPYPGQYNQAPQDWRDNRFQRRIMIGGFDFFPDGKRAALSTWEGDVWIVSGIDATLERLEWSRFASGLFEPLGLKIVGDTIHVTGRDQLTRLHDRDGDGEADFYENFNNQVTNSPGFHEFPFDLQTDPQGNFYTAKAGPVRSGGRGFGGGGGNGEITPMAGALHKISKDGKRRTVIATGFRAPNGLGVGPRGELTTGDNEGTWMPTCPINWVRPGGFYGVEPLAHRTPVPKPDAPLCWLGKAYDNSGGGQVWVPEQETRWGPFAGELLHLSYGRAAVYVVLKEFLPRGTRNPHGEAALVQGGVVRLVGGADAVQLSGEPQKLTSSAMRGRFNPGDGQLYVAGLSGWQSDAVSLTGFDRIRYTGAEVRTVRALQAIPGGLRLRFSHALDPASVEAQSFSGERWNYRRSEDYGSPEFSVEEPTRRGHDRLEMLAARLEPDGKTVSLFIEDLRPVDQMLLRFAVRTVDGHPIRQSIMHTLHHVPAARGQPREALFAQERGKPGALLRYFTLDGRLVDAQVARGVALHAEPGEPPSPLLAVGAAPGQPIGFRAEWQATLTPEQRGPHRLRASGRGALTVELDGRRVLVRPAGAEAAVDSDVLALDGRPLPLRVVLESDGRGTAGVQLAWRALADAEVTAGGGADPGAVHQPVPPQALRHHPVPELKQAELAREGRALFLESRCGHCHLPLAARARNPELAMGAPALDGIGSRRTPDMIRGQILRPAGHAMPRLLPGGPGADEATRKQADADATALTAYLATLTDPATEMARREHVRALDALAAQGPPRPRSPEEHPLVAKLHCGACHVTQQMGADDGRTGLDGVRARFPRGALAEYLLAPGRHDPWTRMPGFALTPAEAVELEWLLREAAWAPPAMALPADAALVARGQALLESTGCLSCHPAPAGTRAETRFTPLSVEAIARGAGCIGEAGPARYRFGDRERSALAALAAAPAGSALVPAGLAALSVHAPIEFARRQIARLRCGGCHGQVDGFPDLDLAGEKLRPEWMAAFLAGRVPYKPRGLAHPDGHPWMEARMPAFPAYAPHLARGLAMAAGLAPVSAAPGPIDQAAAQVGARLVSAEGGFACVGCHAVGGQPATQVFEAEGINLAYAADRLRPEFFARWLRNPMRVDPQTKMPTYFDEGGASPLEDVLGGRADAQIAAMWHYLRTLDARYP